VSGSLGWLGRVPLLVAVCGAVGCLAAGCAAAGSGGPAREPSRPGAGHSTPVRPLPDRSPGPAAPFSVPVVGDDPAQLAGQLTTAERALGGGATAPAAMARSALIVQLACLAVAAHHGWAGAVLANPVVVDCEPAHDPVVAFVRRLADEPFV